LIPPAWCSSTRHHQHDPATRPQSAR
jgi:hypothetical protein